MTQSKPAGPNFADLGVRVASAAVLISIALFDFWMGGLYVTVLIVIGVVLMLWEYRRIVLRGQRLDDPKLWLMCAGGALTVLATGLFGSQAGLVVGLATFLAVASLERENMGWLLPGFIYITGGLMILLVIRHDPARGFPLVLWLVSVVIAADVGGYFAGKLIGGPKLWPRISPNKTWAGTIGGFGLAMVVGTIFWFSGQVTLPRLVLLSGVVAVASQAGDLLESWLKRRYGVKDASSLIPGHGGLLDRFDGLLGALWMYGLLEIAGVLAL